MKNGPIVFFCLKYNCELCYYTDRKQHGNEHAHWWKQTWKLSRQGDNNNHEYIHLLLFFSPYHNILSTIETENQKHCWLLTHASNGECFNGPHESIEGRDVSRVNDMIRIFCHDFFWRRPLEVGRVSEARRTRVSCSLVWYRSTTTWWSETCVSDTYMHWESVL